MRRGQSEAEAMATPWKDALTRSIGTEAEVDADVFGPHALQGDSAFLICSDGLYKTLGDNQILELFVRSSGAQGAAQSLVAAAFDAGSDDNISVAIAEFGEVPREVEPTTMVLSYEPEAASEEARLRKEEEREDAESGAAALDEGMAVPGLPVAAVAAIVVVVTALVAILVFGG
jgi:serine/threonine protein phosphatase PrpC